MTSRESDEPLALASETDPSAPPSEALSDADQILARARLDEEAAARAREEYREHGLPVIEPDEQVRPHLQPDEAIHARRATAMLEITPPGGPSGHTLRGGTLYLTSRRLIHAAESDVSRVPLEEVVEMGVAIERLVMLQLTDGTGIAIEADQPRLLRVQIAAAMAAQRASR
jgi:hypothetical protein